MRRHIKKTCIILFLCCISFLFSGYAASKPHAYFTIYYDAQKIVVTDSYLKPAWYNLDSKKKYKPIYERLDDYEKGAFIETFPELYQIVKKIEKEINCEAFDGTIHFNDNYTSEFRVLGAREGRQLDREKLCKEIMNALRSKKHADIIAPIDTTKPNSAEGVLAQKAALRAVYSTRFDASNLSRAENIKRSVLCFNGLTVAPGESLSFNKTVGPRTAARGYEEANIIIDGEFVKGIGGGVCQTSTTVFNAALLAGLRIAESCNHSLPISYVPLGRDAMVSSAVDLVLENNTGSSIYIESGVEGNRVFVKIYGAKLSVKYRPRIEKTEGEEEIRTATYIEAFKGDRLVNSKLVRKSRYKVKKEEEIIPTPAENLPIPLNVHISA